jgi:AmmeMemoRadiSam system protein B
MKVRKRQLPVGWYPEGKRQTVAKIEELLARLPEKGQSRGVAGIAPHAGWEFSGAIALDVIRHLEGHETIVVIGGHLPPYGGGYAATEAAFETPLGTLEADAALLRELGKGIELVEDRQQDNTVEIHLPMIAYLLPHSKVMGLRAPPSGVATELGKALRQAANRLGRKVVVLGSTDLTHYGGSYGFSPQGAGPEAVRWVKEVNDRRFIDALLPLRIDEAITLANTEKSACSAGGAAAAASFAAESGVVRGHLIGYTTSWDIFPGSSFVGYAGIVYPREESSKTTG